MRNSCTAFEEIGVRMQNEARNAGQAVKQFEKSCDICCMHGLNIACRTCAIQACHKAIMEQRFGRKVIDNDEG